MNLTSKLNMKKERVHFADILRTIAIIFVILIHTTCEYLNQSVLGTDVLGYNMALILDSIICIAVALFFMISGCFLIKEDSELNKQHVKRVGKRIFQLLFWTVCYLLFCRYVLNWDINLSYSLKAMFFSNQVTHLWFMYPLIALYLLCPIVSKLYYSLTKKQINYLLIVTFLIPLIVKTFMQFYSFVSIPLFAVGFSEFGYFILGKYIYDNRVKLKEKLKVYIPIISTIVGLLLIIIYAKYNIYRFGMGDKPFYDYSRFPVALYCISFYTVFLFLESKFSRLPQQVKNIFSSIGRKSGGIYFIHMLVIYIVGNIYIGSIGFTSNEGNLLFMILGALLYFTISWVIVSILNKIPIIRELVN